MRHLLASIIAAFVCTLATVPATAQRPNEPPRQPPATFTLEQRMQLRCSAAFALVARRQAQGDAQALRYPPLATRGREYFVRSAAALMDAANLDRAQIDAAMTAEARGLAIGDTLPEIMPICLAALDGSGL